jgi:predicted metal-dependent RNase
MEELIITKDELVVMFENQELKDELDGWFLNGMPIEIIAIHDTDPKYIQNVTSANYYKLVPKISK